MQFFGGNFYLKALYTYSIINEKKGDKLTCRGQERRRQAI